MAGIFESVTSMPGQREICPTVTAFEEWHAQAGHSEFTVPVAVRRECQGKRAQGDCASVCVEISLVPTDVFQQMLTLTFMPSLFCQIPLLCSK